MKKQLLLFLFWIIIDNYSIQANTHKDYLIDSLKNLLDQTNFDSVKVSLLNQIAWEYLTNKPELSESYLNKAYKISNKISYKPGLGVYYHYKGLLAYYSGNITLALDHFFESYKVRKDANDLQGLASACRVIGVMFADQQLNEKALDYYNQSLDLAILLADTSGMAGAYNNMGVLYSEEGQLKKALEYYEKALTLVKNTNDFTSIGLYNNNIANILQDQGEMKKAEEYYFESMIYKEKAGDYVYLTTLYTDLANYYNKLKKPDLALDYLGKSWKLAQETNLIHELMSAAEAYSTAYELKGAFEKSLDFHKKFKKFNDQVNNEAIASKLTQLEMNLQFEKEKEIERLRQEKKDLENQKAYNQQKTQKNIIIIILLATITIAYFIYRNFITKKKDNILLLQQNEEIEAQRDEISSHRKTLLDSINYAKQIQLALLPPESTFSGYFQDSFIFYLPRDIISGDFYWIRKFANKLYFAVADCTGHGVPGALMSMLGISFLNEIISKNSLNGPANILNDLREHIKFALKQNGNQNDTRDGMDIALCQLDMGTNLFTFSGANNPVYIFQNENFIELKPTENPIGIYIREEQFINTEIQLNKNDILYLFTDGFIDQVNGENRKKYLSSQFKELIKSMKDDSLGDQKRKIETEFYTWKKNAKQVDDITIIGLKI